MINFGRESQYLTENDVTKKYNLSLGCLKRYRRRRVGPEFIMKGRFVLYPKKEIDLWFKTHVPGKRLKNTPRFDSC
jgi:hypothetical protein